MNAKKGIRNIILNFLSQGISILFGAIIPHYVIVLLGSESNGLLNTINQILVYVGLLEAGIGGASLQALYAPVAKDDRQSINQILAATHHFYMRAAAYYFLSIILLAIAFPFAVQSDLSTATIVSVVLLSGMPGVIRFLVYGKYHILLRATGQEYVLTAISILVFTLTSVSKIFLLLRGYDVVALQVVYFLVNLLQTLLLVCYMKKRYSWLDVHVPADFEAISQRKSVLVHQIAYLVYNNTDILLLSLFFGLKTVSVYSMYKLLFGMISSAIQSFRGVGFVLGQKFQVDRERFLQLYDLYETVIITLAHCLYCIARIFILPFMVLYTGAATDINYIQPHLPYLFLAVDVLYFARDPSSNCIEFAGHYQRTQSRAIAESVINLAFSLLLVGRFGIPGVLLGTIIATFWRSNDMLLYTNHRILQRSAWPSYRRCLLNIGMFAGVSVFADWFFSGIALNTYFRIIAWAALSTAVLLPLFFGFVFLFDRKTFRFGCDLVKSYLQSRKH